MLPTMFGHDSGDQIGRYATLVDPNFNEFEVLVQRNHCISELFAARVLLCYLRTVSIELAIMCLLANFNYYELCVLLECCDKGTSFMNYFM
jgi:hypothetical protein